MAGESLIGYANLVTISDKLGLIYDKIAVAVADDSESMAHGLAVDVMENVLENQDVLAFYVVKDLMDAANLLQTNISIAYVVQTLMQNFISTLNQHCLQRGPALNTAITNIDTYASYENNIAFTRVLFSPSFRTAFYLAMGTYPTAANCFAPAIEQGSDYPSGMGKWDFAGGGTPFTDGVAVDTAKYMGAVPKIKVTTPIAYDSDKTLTITVSGKGYDDTNTEITTTWTYTSTGGTLEAGTYNLVGYATKYIRDVTNIALTVSDGGSVSAGVCYVEGGAHRVPA